MRLLVLFCYTILSTTGHVDGENLVAFPTLPASSSSRPRLAKCCDLGFAFDLRTRACLEQEDALDNSFIAIPTLAASMHSLDEHAPEGFEVAVNAGLPNCDKSEDIEILWNTRKVTDFQVDRSHENATLFEVAYGRHHERYCVDHSVGGGTVIHVGLICALKAEYVCQFKPCVRLCCPKHHRYNPEYGGCQEIEATSAPWQPVLVDETKHAVEPLRVGDVVLFHGEPTCADKILREYDNSSLFFFRESGRLVLGGNSYNYSQYCVRPSPSGDGVKVCAEIPLDANLEALEKALKAVLPALLAVSVLFLVATFVVVFVRSRGKMFGLLTLCMVAMLGLFYTGLVISHVVGADFKDNSPIICQAEGLLLQFSYLSALCWLNCISHMIWKNFRRVRRVNPQPSEPRPLRNPQFHRYAAWSFGLPAAVSLVTATMQMLPTRLTVDIVTPDIGRDKCFLADGTPMLLYFHIVTAPCLVFNLLGFVCTSWNLCCGIWSPDSSVPTAIAKESALKAQQRNRLITLIKMFFAMGVSWLAELMSWIFEWLYGRHDGLVLKASFFFDMVNAAQGIFLFAVIYFDSATVRKIRNAVEAMGTKEPAPIPDTYRARHGSDFSGINATVTGSFRHGSLEKSWPRRLLGMFRSRKYDLAAAQKRMELEEVSTGLTRTAPHQKPKKYGQYLSPDDCC